jgi:hypothetical protein
MYDLAQPLRLAGCAGNAVSRCADALGQHAASAPKLNLPACQLWIMHPFCVTVVVLHALISLMVIIIIIITRHAQLKPQCCSVIDEHAKSLMVALHLQVQALHWRWGHQRRPQWVAPVQGT